MWIRLKIELNKKKNRVIAEVVAVVGDVCFPFPKADDLTRPGQRPGEFSFEYFLTYGVKSRSGHDRSKTVPLSA